jgi:hypothetical protein
MGEEVLGSKVFGHRFTMFAHSFHCLEGFGIFFFLGFLFLLSLCSVDFSGVQLWVVIKNHLGVSNTSKS